MGGRETGDSGGWVAAIFSPLGVPTSAREGDNRVSPLIPCYNMKIEKTRKNIIVTLKCTVQLISVTAAPSKVERSRLSLHMFLTRRFDSMMAENDNEIRGLATM